MSGGLMSGGLMSGGLMSGGLKSAHQQRYPSQAQIRFKRANAALQWWLLAMDLVH